MPHLSGSMRHPAQLHDSLECACRASNVWGYLRTSLSCAGRMDLLPAIEDQDLGKLQSELPL